MAMEAERRTRVTTPEGVSPSDFVFEHAAPAIGGAARAYARATLDDRTLPAREAEAARYRIAQINDCRICLTFRPSRPGEGPVGEELYEAVEGWVDDPTLSDRERLAVEFAERFALDHLGLDDPFWRRMHGSFTDEEISELALCVAEWLAVGRVNAVLGLDVACEL